jgi:ribosomal subunit interface protein
MITSITATRLELTPSLSRYIQEKMGSVAKLLGRFERDGELELFFEIARTSRHHKHGEVFYAEATLAMPGKTLRVEEYDADAHAAIDAVKDVLKVEVKRYKERRESKTSRPNGRG